MNINPKEIVDRGFIRNLEGGELIVQQNGIDLTLASVKRILGGTLTKEVRDFEHIEELPDEQDIFTFLPGTAYAIEFQQEVSVPTDMCAQIIQRSTLNRMGAFVVAGLYDSGFKNQIGAVLRTNAKVRIQKGARVAQIVFQQAESASMYAGIYQGK